MPNQEGKHQPALVPEWDRDPLTLVDYTKAHQLIDPRGATYAVNGAPHPARRYWQGSGMSNGAINRLVDKKSRLKFRVPEMAMREILDLSYAEPLLAAFRFIDVLAPLYDSNGYPLSASIKGTTPDGKQRGVDGFNYHGRPHIRTVAQSSLALLEQAEFLKFRSDITPRVKQTTALGAAIHDSINLWTRGAHATGIPILIPHIAPELANSRLWHEIATIGVFHNELQLNELLHRALPQSHTLSDEINLLNELGPGALAVILSDKLHIGQDRLPPEWRHSDGLLRDWNLINACFRTDDAGYTRDGKTFRVNMSYTAGPENDKSHPATISPDGKQKDRFWMPDAIDAYMREEDATNRVAHSEVLEAMMWDTYKDRLRLTILTVFAFNPHAETVELNIKDDNAGEALAGLLPNERIEEVAHRSYVFRRDGIDTQLKAIEEKFGPNGKNVRLGELREAGQALLPDAQSLPKPWRRTAAK